MRQLKLSELFIITYFDLNKQPTVYPQIFTSKEDAEKILPHIGNAIIKEVFINDEEKPN